MAVNGIRPFSVHSSGRAVNIGLKLLSQAEFAVIIFAASGISARSRWVVQGAVHIPHGVVGHQQKNDRAPGKLQSQTALIKGLTERTARWVNFAVFLPASK